MKSQTDLEQMLKNIDHKDILPTRICAETISL